MGTNGLDPALLNTVHCMDCLEFMKNLPDKCIDLVLTDPPYAWGDGIINGITLQEESNNWNKRKPTKQYRKEIKRISKNQIIWGGNYFTNYLQESRGWIVRDKNNGESKMADGELARTNFDKNLKIIKIHWTGSAGKWEDTKEKVHPTQKPVKLFRRILENYSTKGMTILDCFAGSGTTGVACKELGRNYILIEKEPKYVDIIHKRLQNTTVSLFHS